MKKKVEINGRELNRLISESVKRILNEEFDSSDYNNDDEYLESFEYLLESFINGQFSQCMGLIKDYHNTPGDAADFIRFLYENGQEGYVTKAVRMFYNC